MRHIRVLVAGMPRLHADIIKRIVDQQLDMSVIGEVEADGRLRAAVERTDADVMLLGVTGTDPRSCLGLIWEHPWLRVLALDTTGRQHSPIEIRLRGSPEATWPIGLVEAIRHAGEPR
jgi:chemotaxis response regulator CheB